MTDYSEYNEQNSFNAGSGQGGIIDSGLGAVRRQIENQIGQAIDHYAGHVPGGTRFTPEAKQAVSGILDGLQSQLEAEAARQVGSLGGGRLGGVLGGNNTGGSYQGQGQDQGDQGGSLL